MQVDTQAQGRQGEAQSSACEAAAHDSDPRGPSRGDSISPLPSLISAARWCGHRPHRVTGQGGFSFRGRRGLERGVWGSPLALRWDGHHP